MVWDEEVCSMRQDGKKETHGDSVGQERAGPAPGGGEAFYEGEGGVGQGQAMVAVVGGV